MRLTKTWSPMSSVFSIELEGISKACTTNVMMNRPVTSTAASEARNSTVVSRGFSSTFGPGFFSDFFSFVGNGSLSKTFSVLSNHSECSIPSGHLEQMSRCLGEMKKFSTRRRGFRHLMIGFSHRPVDQQRAANHIFRGDQ